MTNAIMSVDRGWCALNGAIVFCPNGAVLPITPEALVGACQDHWPNQTKAVSPDAVSLTSIEIHPDNDHMFGIRLFTGGQVLGLDGRPEQNVMVAAWLRSLMPADSQRIVVAQEGLGCHADLPFGVTPEQIASTMIDHTVLGWNDGDPDFAAW